MQFNYDAIKIDEFIFDDVCNYLFVQPSVNLKWNKEQYRKKNLGKKYTNKISFTHRYPNRHCYRKTMRHLFPLLQSNRAEIVKDSRTRGEQKCDAMESITDRKTVNDRGKNSQINRVSKLDACAKF